MLNVCFKGLRDCGAKYLLGDETFFYKLQSGYILKLLSNDRGLLIKGADARIYYASPQLKTGGHVLKPGEFVAFAYEEPASGCRYSKVRSFISVRLPRGKLVWMSSQKDFKCFAPVNESLKAALRSQRVENAVTCPRCGRKARPLPIYSRCRTPVGIRCLHCGAILKRYADVGLIKAACLCTLSLDVLILSDLFGVF